MKKIYVLIIIFCFLLSDDKTQAQCSVNISAQPKTNQLDCNNTSITLSANAQGSGTITYLWNTGETTASIDVKDSGTYTVTIKDAGTCTTHSSINITQDITTPTVSILAFPSAICSGDSSTLIGIGANTYQWQPGSLEGTTVSVSPAVTTSYIVTGTASNGCSSTNSFKLVVNPLPNASISGTAFGCQNAAEPSITFTGSNGAKPYIFAYNINGGPTQTVTTTGIDTSAVLGVPTGTTGSFTYNLISVTDGNGCTHSQTGTAITTVLAAPFFTSSKTASVCNNSLFAYTAESLAPSTTFSWTRAADSFNASNRGSTNFVSEILYNASSQPVNVYYYFILSTGTGCSTYDTLKVSVNPTPIINPISNYTFCNADSVSGISFSSTSPNASFKWTCDSTIGFGTSGSDSIPAFTATNTTGRNVVAHVTVSITASRDSCRGHDSTFAITVLPGPLLTSPKTASVCDKDTFSYTALSSAGGTNFNWTRSAVAGISNPANSGSSYAINESLNNTTSHPVLVNYVFNLTIGTDCPNTDTLKVIVNPTPEINSISNYTFCNGVSVKGINFTSTSPNASFTWTCIPTIGFGSSGTGNIPDFTASNTDTIAVVAKVTVSITASSNNCPGHDSTFTITVNPSPPKPNFTSLSSYPDNVTLNLCSGSKNINFNVNSPAQGTSYNWTSSANSSMVSIGDTDDPNTVISFNNPGIDTINAIASNATGGCADTVSQKVQVDNRANGIDKRKIFIMQPGNLLIYPDNSLAGYQWGYDTIIRTSPDSAFGPPMPVQGQVYQFFIPDAKFINSSGNSLNETNYLYWVLLQNGDCYTKVYYNGPYDDRPDSLRPFIPPDSIQLQVIPNPNKGVFKIILKGNIYGSIDAKIYNSSGQLVFSKNFVKMTPESDEQLNTNNLPDGLYLLKLNSSDLKKVGSRFVIIH